MPDLPFEVGDLAESRSFQVGYRGAWFRCKIRDIRTKNAAVSHQLEYFDYPDQKLSWIKLYQKPPITICKSKGFKRELMLRPSFPSFHYESEKLDVDTTSEVIVIVSNTWKVGDLVDWYMDGCYWSGSVTKILGNDKVQIDLLPPPLGEGSSYEALCKDLRPSLDWCLGKGWTVPMPMGGECMQPCARIVNPANSDGTTKVGQSTVRAYCSRSSQNVKGLLDCPDRNAMVFDESDSNNERACFSGNVSSAHIMDASIGNLDKGTINGGYNEYHTKKRNKKSLCLNSMSSNTIEAAIMDLEELVNRIKWLKGVLNLKVPLSDTKQPSWEFSQHHAPCN